MGGHNEDLLAGGTFRPLAGELVADAELLAAGAAQDMGHPYLRGSRVGDLATL